MHPHIPSIILTGDALTTLRTLPDQSVQCCVTSPPYWGLRNYGVDSQIGLEPTVEEHIVTLTAVFREVCRVLRDDGTLWVNYGDTYAHDGKWGGSTGGKPARRGQTGIGRRKTTTGLLAKNLIGLPWRLAFALQADGWYLRSDIIWHKPNPMPESVKDRPTRAHEYIFLLSKSERYYYDYEAVKEPAAAFTDHDATGPGYAAPGQTPHRGTRPRPQSARALSFSRTVSEPERPGQMYSQHRPNRNPCPSKGNAKNFRGGGRPHSLQIMTKQMQVRRLTPVESERLQGIPDDYTRIAWRGRAAEKCPDGHRYKAVGNSMPTKVMRWIGERIERAILRRGGIGMKAAQGVLSPNKKAPLGMRGSGTCRESQSGDNHDQNSCVCQMVSPALYGGGVIWPTTG